VVAPVRIAGREIGSDVPCFVIAEAGVNHDGDIDRAEALVDAAAEAGADAVKFQTFRADALATADAPKAAYQKSGADESESQFAMLRRLELDEDDHGRLAARAAERHLVFLSSPFDRASADLLERLDVAAFKVPSGELTNPRLLAHIAAKGRPMIVSTGMAAMGEVAAAMAAIDGAGAPPVVLLHCVSAYPAEPADCNLLAMASLAQRFAVPVGWSDHTLGADVALAAVALGAVVVEAPDPRSPRAGAGPCGVDGTAGVRCAGPGHSRHRKRARGWRQEAGGGRTGHRRRCPPQPGHRPRHRRW